MKSIQFAASKGRVFRTFLVSVSSIWLLASAAPAWAKTVYVSTSGSDANNGLTWATAKLTVQAGLNIAVFGDQVWVAVGRYKPTYLTNSADPRSATFQLKNGVKLYGGFPGQPGQEGNLTVRDPEVYETILTGDLADNDGPDFANNSENTYHVVSADGSITDTSNTILDGFIITGGNTQGDYAKDDGGGINCASASPTIRNCKISGNTANEGVGYGGGVFCGWSSSPVITNCTISGNKANAYGGAVSCYDNSSPRLTGCRIIGNTAADYGGGAFFWGGSPILTNCMISGNKANAYGGGMYNFSSNPTVTNCTFSGNTAAAWSGGICNVQSSSPRLINCILWGNGASNLPQVFDSDSTSIVTHSCVQGGWLGTGNIDADPLFVRNLNDGGDGWGDNPATPGVDEGANDDFGDLRLACGSPCLDAGDNGAVPADILDLDGDGNTTEPIPFDLAGNTRFADDPATVDTGAGSPPIVDMGAYEGANQAFVLPSDPVKVPEGGTADFTVALACDPGGTVEVSVTWDSGDPDIAVQSGSTLQFDSNNYAVPQPVTLAAAEDADRVEGTARIRLEIPGIAYGFVTGREIENDIGPILFVDADASGDNNGTSWDDAFTDLQSALDAASALEAVDRIWIAAGTYRPSALLSIPGLPTDPNDPRTVTFQLINGVAIYGGFAGTEDPNTFNLADRDLAGNQTVLSGDLNGDDRTDGNGENSYHVVVGVYLDSTTVLDGVTITAGNANDSAGNSMDLAGGGMLNLYASPTLTNCVFSGNSADAGGGMGNVWDSSPTLTNCIFSGNSASGAYGIGGGMGNAYSSDPAVVNCTFSGNTAFSGGGLYSMEISSPMLTNCTFSGNSATDGGAICSVMSSATVTACTISGNTASHYGGGMYCSGVGSLTITNCAINANTATVNGGGIWCLESTLALNNSTIAGNGAIGTSLSSGGGIQFWNSNSALVDCTIVANRAYQSGGIECSAGSNLKLDNCAISANTASSVGGGIFSSSSSATLTNCTISGNIISGNPSAGDGIVVWGGNTRLTNCIVWGNKNSEFAVMSGDLIVTYSDIGGGWPGTGNIDADPLFVRDPDPGPDGNWDGVDDDYGDLRLACGSPCLDAGDNGAVPADTLDLDGDGNTTEPIPFDLAGNTRFADDPATVDTGAGSPPIVDMGAYEGPHQAFVLVPDRLNVLEGGPSATFTVALACDPGGTVEVSVTWDSGDPDITVPPVTLTFTSANYMVPQPVSLTAAEDADRVEGTTRFRVQGTGIEHGFVNAGEIENDIGPILFVDADATAGANDGTSWASAFTDLQSALTVASLAPNAVEQIWVAAGTYRPSAMVYPGVPRTEAFQLINGVKIYGGFPAGGGDQTFAARNPDTYLTILSGDLSGNDVAVADPNELLNEPTRAENVYHVLFGMNIDRETVLDGVTITAGNANSIAGQMDGNSAGGGMLSVLAGSLTLSHCTFSGNSASWFGGGMLSAFDTSPKLTDCTFVGNTAPQAGGMGNMNSTPTLVNCEFRANSATWGGGVYNMQSMSDLTLMNCRFLGNTAEEGGGLYNSASAPMLVNCQFVGNQALHDGGGMNNWDGSDPTMINCTFSGNVASLERGGGVYNHEARATMVNCILWGNTASAGPQIALEREDAPCELTVSYSDVQGGAAAVHVDPGAILNWGPGNIDDDPLFERNPGPGLDGQWGTPDDDYGDLRLRAGSPCIDAGNNGAVPADMLDVDGDGDITEPLPFDLAGIARFVDDLLTIDTGLGAPPIVDMGAYEYAPAVLQTSNPADGKSLWRNQKNIIRLTFDADIAAPDAGAVMIQEMLAGGTCGDDLSAGFTFTVENDGQGHPRVLKIRETAPSLQHRKWYAVRNTGDWTGVAPFTVQYVVQVGDANNDGRVLNTDFGVINAVIPIFSAADDDRRDINGDGRVLNTDFGVTNSKIPSFPVAKPSGH